MKYHIEDSEEEDNEIYETEVHHRMVLHGGRIESEVVVYNPASMAEGDPMKMDNFTKFLGDNKKTALKNN